MFEKNLLRGKRILFIRGGSGLGAAMGRRFLELGAELIICGRRLERLEAAAAQMRGDPGGKVTPVRCDIRDGAAVGAMMDAVWREAPDGGAGWRFAFAQFRCRGPLAMERRAVGSAARGALEKLSFRALWLPSQAGVYRLSIAL
jgi:short chain dehydrogenase